ncbi:MAG: hypothetical protein KIT45_08925 [Fimbriimonadia bacterium]|nr:hypothetical protein [Fimbriimonadia bacterium]
MGNRHKMMENNIRDEITVGTWNFIAQYRVIKNYLLIIFLCIFFPVIAPGMELNSFRMPLILVALVVYLYESLARHHLTFNFSEKESIWESTPKISLNRKTLFATGIGVGLGLILTLSVQAKIILRPTDSEIPNYLFMGMALILISLLTVDRLTWQPTKNVGYGMLSLGVGYLIASSLLLIQE